MEEWGREVERLEERHSWVPSLGEESGLVLRFCLSLWIGFWVCLVMGLSCPRGGLGSFTIRVS